MPNLAETRKILANPVNQKRLSKALTQEKWLRFHSKPTITKPEHVDIFLEWVKKLIPLDKYKTFVNLFTYPVETVKVTDEAFKVLEKVFDAKNPVRKYRFRNEESKADWMDYLSEINGSQWWQNTGFETVKYRINSLLVADLPVEQDSEMPEPYLYTLDLSKVIDFELKGEKLKWVIFRTGKTSIAVYDDEAYRVFSTNENENIPTGILVENYHELGECPANFFWSDAIDEKNSFFKQSPITNQLAALDWMLFFAVSKKYNDMYSSYPVYWGYESNCEYEFDTDNQHYECSYGFLVNENNIKYLTSDGKDMACPKCSNSISGVGAMIEVPFPEEGDPTVTPPVGRIDVDKASLDYNIEEYERLVKEFHQSVTGSNLDVITTQAVNRDQVMSIFETKKQILTKFKKNFEKIHQWAHTIMCKLRYGRDFIDCYIDYGTEWYLFTEDELLRMYSDARAAGHDTATLDHLQDQYFDTKFRNNPNELQRTKIIQSVDPFRHMTNSEVKALYDSQLITKEDYVLKVNLSSLIMRFERENGDIVQFGTKVEQGEDIFVTPFSIKIERIQSEIKSYIKPPQIVAQQSE